MILGESASADHEAAKNFPPLLRETIAVKNYVPDQIFNVDETGLYWKKLPNRTWISKEEKTAPGFKIAKDRFTLLLGGNASGTFRCKPMLVYRSETPRPLKGKNKSHLPVYWRWNKTAWVTQINFGEWFEHSFIPEVKEFLASKNLAFKVLLLMDNCKSHVDPNHPNVEVMFLPANTTSLIQPMDQTVIATFKSYYLRRVMKEMIQEVNHHRSCETFDSYNVVKTFWKNFSILDAIGHVDEAWKEVKSTTLNACWSKILPEIVAKKNNPETNDIEETAQVIVNLAHTVDGEGFQDLQASEVMDLVLPSGLDLTVDEIEELAIPLPVEDIESVPETPFQGKAIVEVINLIKEAIELAMQRDPIVMRSLNFKCQCDKALEIYGDLYRDHLRHVKQSKLTDFFKQ